MRRSALRGLVVRGSLAALGLNGLACTSGCHSIHTPLGVAERFLQRAHGKGQGTLRYLLLSYSTLPPAKLTEALRAAALGSAIASGPERRTARRAVGPDEPIELERIGDRFLLTRDPLDAYPRTTAEMCLRSFVRAIDSHRVELLTEFVPRRFRTGLDAEALGRATEGPLRDLADLIRRRLDQPLDYLGPDEARLSLDERRAVRLRRSETGWVVESFDG